ncbi:hypothetical protein MMPV_005449 [Pyropia vietnamensis]
MRITFLHPDLGLGGAERLIIDAATALAGRGHQVTIVTAALDASRCFADVHPDRPVGAVPAVTVLPPPPLLPRTLAGGAAAALAAARMTALAAAVVGGVGAPRPEVVVVDQVAAPVLLLRAVGVPVVFYCHFPDVDVEASLRAAADHGSGGGGGGGGGLRRRVRALYRSVINRVESAGVRAADAVGVNSDFTRVAYERAYPGAPPSAVVYPAVRAVRVGPQQEPGAGALVPPVEEGGDAVNAADGAVPLTLLSINRYERKKNIPLALATLGALLADGSPRGLPPGLRARLRLIHMGGYDERLAENVELYAELAARAAAPDLAGRVSLLRNAPDAAVGAALATAAALLYTPTDEHFGIVPLQAASAGLPVVAVAAGGPLETVVHGVTGWLVAPTAEAFAGAAAKAVRGAAAAAAATATKTIDNRAASAVVMEEGGKGSRLKGDRRDGDCGDDDGGGGGNGGGGELVAERAAMAIAARERVAARFSMAALGRGFEGLALEAAETARRRRAAAWGAWLRSWWGG